MVSIAILAQVSSEGSGSMAGQRGLQDIWEAVFHTTGIQPVMKNAVVEDDDRANRLLMEVTVPEGVSHTEVQRALINSSTLSGAFRRLRGVDGPVVRCYL